VTAGGARAGTSRRPLFGHEWLAEPLDRLRVRRISAGRPHCAFGTRRPSPRCALRLPGGANLQFAEAWPADGWSATIRRRVHGQRPPLGGETTVARRTLGDQAAWAPRAKGWDRQPNAAPAEKEGPISRPGAIHREGATPGSPWLPLLERAAPDGSTRATTRGRSNRLRTSRRGALPPMKRSEDARGPPDKGRVRRGGATPWPSLGDAPSWEDSARRPDSARP
jgi:hypothetical protein